MKRQKIRFAIIFVSFLLFPITIYYFSPVIIYEGAIKGILVGSGIIFIFQAITAILFGRAFCGWVCPAGGIQEAIMKSRDRKTNYKYYWIKWAIWLPWIGGIIYSFVLSGGIKSIDFFAQTKYGISLHDIYGMIPFYSVVFLIVILGLTIGKRAFCHYACWMAPFMIIGERINRLLGIGLRLEATPDSCVECGVCAKKCPMSIEVDAKAKSGDMRESECILCGECVDSCKKGAIKYKFCK